MGQTDGGPVTGEMPEARIGRRSGPRGTVEEFDDDLPTRVDPPSPSVDEDRELARERVSANLEDVQSLAERIRMATRAKSKVTFIDVSQVSERADFQFPPDVDFEPTTDDFDPTWLTGDALRQNHLFAAFGRVEFLDRTSDGNQDRIFLVRIHFA